FQLIERLTAEVRVVDQARRWRHWPGGRLGGPRLLSRSGEAGGPEGRRERRLTAPGVPPPRVIPAGRAVSSRLGQRSAPLGRLVRRRSRGDAVEGGAARRRAG